MNEWSGVEFCVILVRWRLVFWVGFMKIMLLIMNIFF